jgi:polyisoprenoid-binding protein YceI
MVDMTTLKSDKDRRDAQLRGRGIQSDTFPTSTFDLATPVALPADFGSTDVAVTLPGKLTLHGVVKDVTIDAQARLEPDGTVVVAGSLPILFADYGIEAPNVAGIIAVEDNGTMEFRVVFAKG